MKYKGRIVLTALFIVSAIFFKINVYLQMGYIPLYQYIGSAIFIYPSWWLGGKYDESKFYFEQLKKAKRYIQESEEKYRLITEHSYDLIKVVDKNGIIHYASPSHKRLLGFTPEEYVGKHILDGIHPKYIETFQSWLMNPTNESPHLSIEVQRKHQNGSWIWLESFAQKFMSQNSETEQYVITTRDVTEKKKYEEKLKQLAFHDSLTGVPNRSLFEERVNQAIQEAQRYKRKIAVMYIDLDKFKQINDYFGHDIGDELLKQFTQRVKNCIRESDILARLGGDEFVILLPDIHHQEVPASVAKKILDVLRVPWIIEEHTFITTSSIGVAIYEDDEGYKALIKRADRALYDVKESGKNTFKIANQ